MSGELAIVKIAKKSIGRISMRLGYRITKIKSDSESDLQSRMPGWRKLSQNYSDYEYLKLQFGCGSRILKGWVNIGLAYTGPCEKNPKRYPAKYPYPDPEEMRGNESDFYALDITKVGLPLPDSCVDVIFHEDFLEHLDQRGQIVFLAETLRVLKPGSIHRVNTPNLVDSMLGHSDFTKGFAGVYVDEWDRWGHLSVLTAVTLKEMAIMVGYSKVMFNEKDKSISGLVPLEYRPGEDRPQHGGNVFADLIK